MYYDTSKGILKRREMDGRDETLKDTAGIFLSNSLLNNLTSCTVIYEGLK
jgi:hypothetical protein